MVQEEVLSMNSIRAFSPGISKEETRQIRMFVPVDFSQCSYNALEYALKLAKACHGSIGIFHVSDISGLPESDNPVVMQRLLSRLEAKTASRVASLKEMISESGVPVASCEFVVGHVRESLQQKIEQVSPDIVITGRSRSVGQTLSFMIRHLRCPVLVVPDTMRPEVPSTVVLSSDRKPIAIKALEPLFRIMQGTSNELSVLNVHRAKNGNGHLPEFTVPINGYDFRVSYQRQEGEHVVNSVDSFVRSNKVDLLCAVHRNGFSLKKFFQKSISSALIRKLDIPVLLVRSS